MKKNDDALKQARYSGLLRKASLDIWIYRKHPDY